MPKGFFARHSAQYTCPATIAPNFSLARALWIPAVLTWDEETGEVREGLHDVVQERLELVREIDVVNDHVVVAGLLGMRSPAEYRAALTLSSSR